MKKYQPLELIDKHERSINLLNLLVEADEKIRQQKYWLVNHGQHFPRLRHKANHQIDITRRAKKRIKIMYTKLQTNEL